MLVSWLALHYQVVEQKPAQAQELHYLVSQLDFLNLAYHLHVQVQKIWIQ